MGALCGSCMCDWVRGRRAARVPSGGRVSYRQVFRAAFASVVRVNNCKFAYPLLSTVPADLPWDAYVAALRPQGKLCIVGIPGKPVACSPRSLIGGESGLPAAGPMLFCRTEQMLDCTARHPAEH